MIEVSRHEGGIIVSGHACYAELGKDIVCAGVSALVQTLIAAIEKLTADKIQYSVSPGTVDIKHGNLSERSQVLVDSFFLGVQMISENYPENVQIVQTVEDGKSYEV
ncbi:MAG: ribosomal-processing cysteine protease Prp [Oscillospiraceae bacterium]